jgi:hypothetical protein
MRLFSLLLADVSADLSTVFGLVFGQGFGPGFGLRLPLHAVLPIFQALQGERP